MKNRFLFLLAILSMCVTLPAVTHAQINRLLPIAARLQWDNANGYCGEESIQMCGLYFGNYISQDVVRTVAGGELLIGVNDVAALNAFSFNCEEWDFDNQVTPQYQNYLVWVKEHLYNYSPVIITVFVQGMSDPDYDHIIPAIGFNAATSNSYSDADQLIFHDCYAATPYTRSFVSMWDTRSMNGNGATYEYCIPKNVDYGCAVTGIKDPQSKCKPVRLTLNRWDEPNVTLGEPAESMTATITIESLTAGQQYALLRYNNYTQVPATDFNPAGAGSVVYFTAADSTKTLSDNFMSNTAVFYRCVEYTYNGTEEQKITNDLNLSVYPNPVNRSSRLYFTLNEAQNVTMELFDVNGRLVENIINSEFEAGEHQIALNTDDLPEGVYYCRMISKDNCRVLRIMKN
ncbi:MAG: T9SS type A sorting domain-containing protein [Bacteroidota bacterium]